MLRPPGALPFLSFLTAVFISSSVMTELRDPTGVSVSSFEQMFNQHVPVCDKHLNDNDIELPQSQR